MNEIDTGLHTIMTSENIAIVVLMVCLAASFSVNVWMIRVMVKTLKDVAVSITTLNERLGRHDHD